MQDKSREINVSNLPLIAKYRVFSFHGSTDGLLPLTPLFNIEEIRGRVLIIKSFRFDYYVTEQPFYDIELSDGVNTYLEPLQRGARINRLFDEDSGMQIDMRINGAPIGIFGNNLGGVSYPADLYLDNIYYKTPEKVQDMTVRIAGRIFDSPNGALVYVTVKVTMECFLL